MAQAAQRCGLGYLAITEHSRRLTVAHGLDLKRLRKQMHEIDRLNEELDGITLLKGVEVDILEDGRLDLPDDVLGELDLVVGAVHSNFKLSRAKQTDRILRAMDRPHFTMLAHPTGRLLESASRTTSTCSRSSARRASAAVSSNSTRTRSGWTCWTCTARWRGMKAYSWR